MANRIAATYAGSGSSQTTHTITFTAPTAGARLIAVVSGFTSFRPSATPAGWTEDYSNVTFSLFTTFYSKIATGSETSLTLSLLGGGTANLRVVVYERDDCQELAFTGSGSQSGGQTSMTASVPSGAGRVFAAYTSDSGSGTAVWNLGLATDFSATGSPPVFFASGGWPSAGSQTWTVSGLPGSAPIGALAGYKSADAIPPSTPPNLRATAVGGTSFSVAWDASTDNVGVTGYGVYLNGTKQGDDQVGLTKSFGGLTAGQSYLVEVDAVDGTGNRSGKAQLTVTTDGTPPSVPPNLRVIGQTFTSVSFAWDASTDNIGVTGYGVYKDGVKQGGDQAEMSATFGGLTSGQSVTVGVDAVDGAGNRSARAEVTATATADVTAPTVPGDLRVVEVGPYSVTVAWDASTDDVAVAGYGVYVDGVKQGGDVAGLTATLPGLTVETSYLVEVDAVDAADNRSGRAEVTVTTPADLPPGLPGNLRETGATYTSVEVAWDAAVDDVGVTGYDIRFDGVLVAEDRPGLSYVFDGLVNGTDYLVEVAAVDTGGQRSGWAQLVAATLDDEDPSAPVVTVVAGEDSLDVSWTASSDDFGVVGYEVVVDGAVVWSTDGVDHTVDGPRVRAHTVTDLVPNAPYEVRVAAVDTAGQRSSGGAVTAFTLPVPFVPVASPVYRLGGWAGNVVDEHGVTWVVGEVEGWASTPPVSPVAAGVGGRDGAHAGAGRYGPRLVVLSGVAVARSRAAMLAAQARVSGVLHPREVGVLRVEDARATRHARVRLTDRVEVTDRGGLAFEWRMTLSAADPRRYAPVPVSATGVIDALPGSVKVTLPLGGNYPRIPARLRLYGPVKNWTVTHVESGMVLRGRTDTAIPADPEYSLLLDLGARMVWSYVPPGVSATPRPGRAALAHLPAWFMLLPGANTLEFAGESAGEAGQPRLVVEAFPAWV